MDRKHTNYADHLMDIYTSPTRSRETTSPTYTEEDESVTWQASQSSMSSINRLVNQDSSSDGPTGWYAGLSTQHYSSIHHRNGPSEAGPSNPSKRRTTRPVRSSRLNNSSLATDADPPSGPKRLLDAVKTIRSRLDDSESRRSSSHLANTPSGSSSSSHGKAMGTTSTMGAVYSNFSRQRDPAARSTRGQSVDREINRIFANESNAKRRVVSFNDVTRNSSQTQSDRSMLVDSGGSFQSSASTAHSSLSSNPSMDISPLPATRTKDPTRRFSSFSPDAPLPFIGQPENAPSPTPDPPFTSTPRSQVSHPPPSRAPALGMRRPHTGTSSTIANSSLPTKQNAFKPPFKKSQPARPTVNPNATRRSPPPPPRNTSRPAPARQVQPVKSRAPAPAPAPAPGRTLRHKGSIPDILKGLDAMSSSPPSSPSARPHDGDPNSSIEFGSFNYDMDDVERVMQAMDASQQD